MYCSEMVSRTGNHLQKSKTRLRHKEKVTWNKRSLYKSREEAEDSLADAKTPNRVMANTLSFKSLRGVDDDERFWRERWKWRAIFWCFVRSGSTTIVIIVKGLLIMTACPWTDQLPARHQAISCSKSKNCAHTQAYPESHTHGHMKASMDKGYSRQSLNVRSRKHAKKDG